MDKTVNIQTLVQGLYISLKVFYTRTNEYVYSIANVSNERLDIDNNLMSQYFNESSDIIYEFMDLFQPFNVQLEIEDFDIQVPLPTNNTAPEMTEIKFFKPVKLID